jgi:hypothetical protein
MSEKVAVAVLTASGLVGQNNAVYHGFIVTTATATADILIKKGTSASGTVVDVIPSASAKGSSRNYAHGIAMDAGLFVDFNGASGTVSILYE